MNFKKAMFAIIIAALMFLTACNTTVNKTDEKSTEPETKTEETTETKEETKEEKTEEKTDESADASEEEAWKKEPAYGKKVKIGYNGGLCTGAPGIAQALGMFKDEGVDVELVKMDGTVGTVDAVGTGQVDMVTNHISAMVVPATNGINMVFKKGVQTGCKSLYVLKDGPINSTKDLVGKSVGLPNGIGNSDHNIAIRFMNHDGIDPKEITWKPVESSASILALQNGEIDSVILSDQFAEKFMNDGTLKVIRSLTWDDDFKKEPCCIYAFNKDFNEKNPITAKKMTAALFKVSDYIAHNVKEATQVLFDNNWASGDFDQAVRMMESYDWQCSNDMTETTLKNILDDYKKFNIVTNEKSSDELLNELWKPEDLKHDNEK